MTLSEMLSGHLRVGAEEESYRTVFITLCHRAALCLCGDAKGSSLCVVRRDVFVQLLLQLNFQLSPSSVAADVWQLSVHSKWNDGVLCESSEAVLTL